MLSAKSGENGPRSDHPLPVMRIVMDYRPALRARSGVGEWVHQVARALRDAYPGDALTLFTSSWKDRPPSDLAAAVPGARISDHRLPVSLLNLAWHNLQWPPVERLTGERYDIAFSPHPLLLPARSAAQVVMVHDLDFLTSPERTAREIRRDYPRLAGAHARRARAVIVPSDHTAQQVGRMLEVPRERISVCPAGVPEWPAATRGFDRRGYVLFFGTNEPRKNVPGLLAAYRQLSADHPDSPTLVMAGRAGLGPDDLEDALRGRVEHRGYVPDGDRQALYLGARVLVLPSFEEGFGMPVLEAMSLGIPVVVSARGALPELVREAGVIVDPADTSSIAHALRRVLTDDPLADALASRGLARAAEFSWGQTATAVRRAFEAALE